METAVVDLPEEEIEEGGRRDEEVVDVVEKPVEERPVEPECGLLSDDVAVVGRDDASVAGVRRWETALSGFGR